MIAQSLLRHNKRESENTEKSLAIIDADIQGHFRDEQAAVEAITEILDLMYRAFENAPILFISELFFEHHVTMRKTDVHQARIEKELQVWIENRATIDGQVNLVNIYRNVVSDCFDPHLSLIVACLELVEGRFTSYLDANLGSGERSKFEYSLARLKPTHLFDGYEPLVRNAVSHTGSDSILYEDGSIIFREIKRGKPPQIKHVKWSTDDLINNIRLLLEFCYAVDTAINIFGIDNADMIKNNSELSAKFLDIVATKENRREIMDFFYGIKDAILSSSEFDSIQKQEKLSQIFFLECAKREMPVSSVRFNSIDKIVFLEIPGEIVNYNDDNLINQSMQLIRYGIIAEPCFGHAYTKFFVTEIKQGVRSGLEIRLMSTDLKAYGDEKAGLLDLLHDGEIYLDGKKVIIEIDFEKNKELEYSGLGRIFPKKER